METCIGCIPDEKKNKKSHDFEKILKRFFLRKRVLFEPYLERKAGHFIDTLHKKIIPIPQGKVVLGSSSGLLYKDFHIEGLEVEENHCFLLREGYLVTLYPVATSTFVDGHRVIKPVRLEDNVLLRLGKSNVFRVRLPQDPHVNQWNTPGYLSRNELQQQIRLHYGKDLIASSYCDSSNSEYNKLHITSLNKELLNVIYKDISITNSTASSFVRKAQSSEHFSSPKTDDLKTAKFDDLKKFLLAQATKRLLSSKDCSHYKGISSEHNSSICNTSFSQSSNSIEKVSFEQKLKHKINSTESVNTSRFFECQEPLPNLLTRSRSDSLLYSSLYLQIYPRFLHLAPFSGNDINFEKILKGNFKKIKLLDVFSTIPVLNRKSISNYELSCMNDNYHLHLISPFITFSHKGVDEKAFNMDHQDFENLSTSHMDLKNLYEKQKTERLREQQRAADEQKRLEELLKMCQSFEVGVVPEHLNDATPTKDIISSEGRSMKEKQTFDQPNLASADVDSDDHVSPAVDSGVEFCSPDWSQMSQRTLYKGARTSRLVTGGHRSLSEDRKYLASAESDYATNHPINSVCQFLTPLDNMRFGSDSKLWEDSSYEIQILCDLRRDVMQNVAEMKNKLSEIESHHNEVLREFDVERALMEGEYEILLGQHEEVQNKLAEIELKRTNLLDSVHIGKDKDLVKFERNKLKNFEAKRKAFEMKMSGEMSDEAEVEAAQRELDEAKEAVENQKCLVENLEFQILEGESKLEDDKEKSMLQLMEEKDILINSCKGIKDSMDHISGQKFELIKQIESDILEIEGMKNNLCRQLEKEELMMTRVNQQIECLKFIPPHGRSHRIRKHSMFPRKKPENMTKSSRSLSSTTERLRHASRTMPRLNTLSGHIAMNLLDRDDGRTRSCIKARKCSSVLPECLPSKTNLIRKAASWLAIPSDTDDSSVSESGNNSDRAMSISSREDHIEKIKDMECQLILAKAEKMRLLEKQKFLKEKEETLEEERQKRMEIERKLTYELNTKFVKKSFKHKCHNPAADQAFNLITYITSCGHNLEQCHHVLLTSSSCRGLLTKMTGGFRGHLKSWKKRWFLFDKRKRCLSYYSDKREDKPRNVIYFQSIEDVFVDHLHQVNSPTPQLTFCIKTCERAFYLVAPTLSALRIWIDVILTGAEAYHL